MKLKARYAVTLTFISVTWLVYCVLSLSADLYPFIYDLDLQRSTIEWRGNNESVFRTVSQQGESQRADKQSGQRFRNGSEQERDLVQHANNTQQQQPFNAAGKDAKGPGSVSDKGPGSVSDKGPGSVSDKGPGSVSDKGPGSVSDKGPGSASDKGPVQKTTASKWKSDFLATLNKPDPQRLANLLQHLNLTDNQSVSHLPLTLAGPDRLANASVCRTFDGRPVDVVFLVHTSTGHAEQREKMRDTFLNPSLYSDLQVRSLFLVGETNESKVQEALEREHAHYGDLLQGRFVDSYVNLTHKAVMGLRFLYDHCVGVRAVIKIDDDVFVDPFKLQRRYWHLVNSTSRAIWCSVLRGAPVHRLGKWAIDQRLFRKITKYPYPFCMGIAVIFTGDLVPSLYAAASKVPFFWVDDVYVYGMLTYLSGNVIFHQVGQRIKAIIHVREDAVLCVKGQNCAMLIATADDPTEFRLYWNSSVTAEKTQLEGGKVLSLSRQQSDDKAWKAPYIKM